MGARASLWCALLCGSLASCGQPASPERPSSQRQPASQTPAAQAASSSEPSIAPAVAPSSAPPVASVVPAPPGKKRIFSIGQTTWIRKRPVVKEGEFLGYVRNGSSVPLRDEAMVRGQGCPGGFYQVEPRGFVCADRTVTERARDGFREAAAATLGGDGPLPYGYALSSGAPMYNRIPTQKEQARYERWHGKPGEHKRLPKTLRSHEELATFDKIVAKDPVPSFLLNGASPKLEPYDLVEQTIPLGAMLSYTKTFEAEGRVWLLSSDHTLVPADRVRPFRPSAFRGVELAKGKVELPIAWMRERARPRYRKVGDTMEPSGEPFGVRTWVGLTGDKHDVAGVQYLETRDHKDGATSWVRAADATVVEAESKQPQGVKPGQKWLHIRLTQGTLVAYAGLDPQYATLVSPGKGGVPVKGRDNVEDSTTPLGAYSITFKDKAATMSPETGKNRAFWIQDVPHTQYFDPPFALHASYWHERFGEYVSAGCVNLSPIDAEIIFDWTDPPVPPEWQGATGAGAAENGPTTIVVVRR